MKKDKKDKLLKGLRYKIGENGVGTLEIDEERLTHYDFSLKVESLPMIFVSLNEYLGYPQDKLPWDSWRVIAFDDDKEHFTMTITIVDFVNKYKDYYISWCMLDPTGAYIFHVTKDQVVWKEENKFFHSFQDKETKLVYITPKWEIKLKKHRKKERNKIN